MSLSLVTPRAPDLSGCALDSRYELHSLIGEGAFGRVYRGLDRRLARAVAVKVIKPWWAEDPDWVHSFEREAQLMASVSDPGIVQIFDVGRAHEGLYYVAELMDGESVAARLRRGPLGPWEAREIAEQLSHALASAHARRIVHRDIKPANVLISSGGRVKVTDFGVAGLLAGTSDQVAATVVGTPCYMAPEQARGLGATPATDVYSVGVVLYEMLAGHPPFAGGSAVELALAHLQDPPPPLPPTVPDGLTAVVERALAKDPDQRYRNGGEMADALGRARRFRRPAAPADVSRAIPSDPGPIPSDPGPIPSDPGPIPSDPGPIPSDPEAAPKGVATTLVAAWRSPRRNINPSARRRTVAAFSVVLLLLLGMVGGAIVTSGPVLVRVPDLHGLARAAIRAQLARAHLHFGFRTRYSAAQPDTAIAQSPVAGIRVSKGSKVIATLSAGPPPVAVPRILGFSSSDAQSTLQQLGLTTSITEVPAPGASAGTVTAQTPAAGVTQPQGSTVSLSVAETPRWRTLLAFTDRGGRFSPPFRIRGTRWRIVYRMTYDGICTFIFICSGPTARISDLDRATTVSSFSLVSGSGQARTFDSGPDIYQVRITPGEDSTSWSAQVQDYY